MATALKSGDKFLFIGDSITDCGRRDVNWRPMGKGYVSYVRDFFVVREPEKQIEVMNTGTGGNTVEDLRSRWEDDALNHEPNWMAIKIGINDCLRWCGNAVANPLQSPESFELIYDQLLTVTREALPQVKLVLIDPFYSSADRTGRVADSARGGASTALKAYLAAVERMAKKHGTRHVRTNDAFWSHFQHQPQSVFFPDEPVHPNQTGHMLIAETVWAELGQ